MNNSAEIAPDLRTVTSVSDIDLCVSNELRDALSEARSFLTFFEWGIITSEYLGDHFEGICSIFLFGIEPDRDDVDRWVWVFVGDIPPAYITCDDAKSPYEALDGYIGAMEEWVQAARDGASVAEMIPVNVPATPEYASALDSRLKFLDEKILPLLERSSP